LRDVAGAAALVALSLAGPLAWADDLDEVDDPAVARSMAASGVTPATEQSPAAAPTDAVPVAAEQPPAAAPAPAITTTQPTKKRHRFLGAMVDFGPPDFLGAAMVGRPLKWMRLHFGMVTNFAAPGIRGGVTFVPVNWYISPSVTIEGGRMFEGNANTITSAFGISSRALNSFGYDFMNLHGGVELGAPNRFLFFIHLGVSYMVMHMTDGSVQQIAREQTMDPTLTVTPVSNNAWPFSGKIGFALYL
jgi:hypothetical protein